MKRDLTGWGCFGIVAYSVVLVIASSVISGLVLRQLWFWFIVPVFNTPALTTPQAIGLNIIAGLFLVGATRESNKWEDNITGALLEATMNLVIRATLFLTFGWIVQSFM